MRSFDRGRTWRVTGEIPGSNSLPFWFPGPAATIRAHVLEFPNGNWVAAIRHGGIYWSAGGPLILRKSSHQGRTWSAPEPLRYEPGETFDPHAPLQAGFLNHNEGYPGNNILVRSDGALLVCLAHANADGDPRNDGRPWRLGSLCFQGTWDPVTILRDPDELTKTENHPSWRHMYLMMMAAQVGFAVAYLIPH